MQSSLWSLLLLLNLLLALPSSICVAASNHLRQGNQVEDDDGKRNLIVNGVDAQPNEFPWFASMLRHHQNEQPGCGGTLISPNRVLTAAHCMIPSRFVPELGPPAYVRIGHTTHSSDGQVVPVECVVIHPDYVSHYNDIAIVKLAQNVTISTLPFGFVEPSTSSASSASSSFATLNRDTEYPATKDQPLTVIGFGAPSGFVAFFGTILGLGRIPKTRRLQKLTTHFMTEKDCRKKYKCADSTYYTCAQAEGKDAGGICYGDSGGPLLDENNVVIGVTTFKSGGGLGCADEKYPDMFANVAQYTEWIQNEIDSSSNTCPTFSREASTFEKPCDND